MKQPFLSAYSQYSHKTHIGTQGQQTAIEKVMEKNLLGDMVRKEALL